LVVGSNPTWGDYIFSKVSISLFNNFEDFYLT